MKNIIKYTTFATTILIGIGISQSSKVFAADGASMKSIGSISYVIDNSPVNPIDPINPDPNNPITPDDPGDHEKPTSGPLSIDYVSNIKFGEQKTTGSDITYYAQLDHITDSKGTKNDRPNFVQVTDKRGTDVGWHLTVTQDEQFKNGKEELQGAVLSLNHSTLSTPNDGVAPTTNQSISLTPGKASTVLDAKVNQGTGTWLDRFGNDQSDGKTSITLSVPGKTKKIKGEYKSSLTWTLTDSPA